MPNGRTTSQAADLETGIETLRTLEEVTPEDAEGPVADVFEDIRATLRVPFVNSVFRVLAAGPPFLAPGWHAVAPLVGTVGFEERSDALRRMVAETIGPVPTGLTLELPDDEDAKVRAWLDSVHYVLPKLALVAELFDRVARRDTSGSGELQSDRLPRGPAKGTLSVGLKEVNHVDGAVRRTFKDIQRTHDHPLVASFYRGLANWPLAMQAAWGSVASSVGSDRYLDLRDAIQKEAYDRVAHLRIPEAHLDGLRDADLQEVRDLLAVFRMRMIPDLLQDVVRIKAALDGPGSAASSRFSAAKRSPHQPTKGRSPPGKG